MLTCIGRDRGDLQGVQLAHAEGLFVAFCCHLYYLANIRRIGNYHLLLAAAIKVRLSYNLGLEIKNWLLVTPWPCWISKSLSLEPAWYLSESSIPSQHFLLCPPPAFSGTSKGNLHDFFSFHHLQRHFFPHLWWLKKPNSPLALIHNVLEPSLTHQLSRGFPRGDNSHTPPPPRNVVSPGHTEHSSLS